jgi:hypothetical protein
VVSNVLRLPAPTLASTWAALANQRHRDVAALRREGRTAEADALFEDVRKLDDLARAARVREANAEIDRQRREATHRAVAKVLAGLLDAVEEA